MALAIAAALLTLLAVESVLRLTSIGAAGRGSPWFAGGSHPRFLFQRSQATGYALRPGFQGRDIAASGEFDVPVKIDAQGLRQHNAVASADRPPVLVLGDSMTYGEGVTAEQAFPALLEARIERRVINGGVPGFDSRQMTARGRQLVASFNPNLVLVVFAAAWDLDRCSRPFVYRDGYIVAWGWRHRLELVNGNLYPWEIRSPWIGPLTAKLQGHSRLARLALPALFGLAHHLLHHGAEAPLPPPAAWDSCATALTEFSSRVGEEGRRLLVVLIDSPEKRDVEATGRIARRLTALALPHILLDNLLPVSSLEARRYPIDRHWNATGHRAVAQALAPVIQRLERQEPSP